ncbi:MAG: ABC transporter ATP-binding protein/permease [Lachnoclostridium sp.]|jgi:ATP-binding cassette subfamily B protein|nr:ABC transporter ATP-binding protein/permease [Lachnoclostridium sp.]
MKLFNEYWKDYKHLFFLSIFCVAMEAVCDLMIPQIMSRLIDNGVIPGNMKYVMQTGGVMLAITATGAVFACTRNILSSKVSQKIGSRMRYAMFVKINRLSISDAEKFDGGSLITRMTNDIVQITNFTNGIMRFFIKAPITCIGCIILAAVIDVNTILIVLSIVLISCTALGISMKLSYPIYEKVQNALDKINTTIREYLIGIRLVRAFGRNKYEQKRFEETNDDLSNITAKAERISAVFSPIASLSVNMGIAIIIFAGSRLVVSGDMMVGEIVAFVSYMTQILFMLVVVTNILNFFVRTRASYRRVSEVLLVSDDKNFADGQDFVPTDTVCESMVSFHKVSFSYPLATGEMALQNIDFTIKKRQTLGIIGSTGSGKSTLTSLLLRFYDATKGSIIMDGKPISELPAEYLCHIAAIVPQTPMLFSGTIRENICFGNENASEDEIEAAANAAEAAEFISASGGFDTYLEQHGTNLSGGQKQRLSIARAIVGHPKLLILDDCTSALDTITETRVMKNLKKYSENLTCIIISQRIRSVMGADRILVLDNGHQVGYGTHNQLMSSCETYREIYRIQMEGGVVDE